MALIEETAASPEPVQPGPRDAFALDVERYRAIALGGAPTLQARLRLWALNRDFRCVACFRFGQAAREAYACSRSRGLPLMLAATLWRRRVARIDNALIDPSARIGPGFYLVHAHGVFLGPVSIGDNCVLHQNVTIGQRVSAGDHGVPTLGDNVWVGPGATLTGDIRVGDNVTISAGTVLSKSVPDGSLVAGNPGRVVAAHYDSRPMLNYTLSKERIAEGRRHDSG